MWKLSGSTWPYYDVPAEDMDRFEALIRAAQTLKEDRRS